MTARALATLPERVVSADDIARGIAADVQANGARMDGAVVNGTVEVPHHGGPCAFLVGRAALEYAYGEGRGSLSSARGWAPLIGRRFGQAVINSDEPRHASERRRWSELFSTTAIAEALTVIDGIAQAATETWASTQAIDAHDAARRFAFEAVARALAGVDDPVRIARLHHAFATVLDGPRPGESEAAVHARLGPEREVIERDLGATIDAMRGELEHGRGHGRGLLPALIAADDRIDDTTLLQHLNLLVIVGHETTATLVAWSLLMACDHPDWQERLAREIDGLPCAAPSPAALENLPLLDAFVAEVGRLRPPVVNAPRLTTEPFTYDRVCVPAGHPVALAIGATQRSDPSWPDPMRFAPERFVGVRARGLLTFGTGARHCLGARFATLEAKLVLRRVLARSRLQRSQPGVTVHAGFWNGRPAGATGIRLLPRESAPGAA